LSDETLERSALGTLAIGDRVNLERAMTLVTRLGGHLVQGHVDATGEVVERTADGAGGARMRFTLPKELLRYVVHKGSITIDGVSLTVAERHDDGITVALIPHTLSATTLGSASVGAAVNVEGDLLAKHVEALMERAAT